MPDPGKYTRDYSFTDYQASNPSAPLPGLQVDNELENVETSLGEIVDAIKDVRRSDGALKNGIVTVDSLDATVAAGVGAGALASAEAAASSASAAADSAEAAASSAGAASGFATAASGYAGSALTSRNEAATEKTLAQTARTGAQTARDFAYQWSSAASGVDVDDGVNPVGKSSYHWAQVALDAAAGSVADGSITTAKLADGALSADTTGRAKMADGFVTSAKIADGTIATGDLADGSVTTVKLSTDVAVVRFDAAQSRTEPEKTQARDNIGFTPALVAYNRWKTIYDDDLPNAIALNLFDLGDYISLRADGSYYGVGAQSILGIQFSSDNGSTWITANNYFRMFYGIENGVSVVSQGSIGFAQLTGLADTSATAPHSFIAGLQNFNKSVAGVSISNTAGSTGSINGGYTIDTIPLPAAAVACNALRFRPSAGTGMGGHLHLEGRPG